MGQGLRGQYGKRVAMAMDAGAICGLSKGDYGSQSNASIGCHKGSVEWLDAISIADWRVYGAPSNLGE